MGLSISNDWKESYVSTEPTRNPKIRATIHLLSRYPVPSRSNGRLSTGR